jgi:hypothetical protein
MRAGICKHTLWMRPMRMRERRQVETLNSSSSGALKSILLFSSSLFSPDKLFFPIALRTSLRKRGERMREEKEEERERR